MHRSEGSLSLEFATQEGRTYVVECTQDLATGQWEAITTVQWPSRSDRNANHRAGSSLSKGEGSQWCDPIKEFIPDREFNISPVESFH